MKRIKINLFIWFLILGATQSEAQDKVKLLHFSTYTSRVESKHNEPVRGIKCDSLGYYFLLEDISNNSFIVNISIWSYDEYNITDIIDPEGNICSLVGVFVNGKKESLWKKYGGVTLIREETYKDGVLHGMSRVFADDGKLLYQTIFTNGTGYYKEYYSDNKQLFLEGEMQNGKREGEWIYYFKTGAYSRIENYKDGQLHGAYKVFAMDGKTLYSTELKNGTGWYKIFNTQVHQPFEENKLLEEGQLKHGYRIGEWTKIIHDTPRSVIYTKDSPENKRLHHNLIEIVYLDGKVYYINADDLQKQQQ